MSTTAEPPPDGSASGSPEAEPAIPPRANLDAIDKEPTARQAIRLSILGFVILVATSFGVPIVAHYMPPPDATPSYNCAESRAQVIALVEAHPEITAPYGGPEEEQCDLNEVAQQARDAAKPKPTS